MKKKLVMGSLCVLSIMACNPTEGIDPEADVTIQGRVLDANGNPIENVEVAWLKNDIGQMTLEAGLLEDDPYTYDLYNDIGEQCDIFEYTTTNSDGSFTISFKGQQANRSDSTNEDRIAANHQIMILQEVGESNGFPVILSRYVHQFSPDSGLTWNVGNVYLWNDTSVSQDNDGQHLNFSWSQMRDNRSGYFLKIRDVDYDPTWEALVSNTALSLPIEAIHYSRVGNEFAIWGYDSTWEFRTDWVDVETDELTSMPEILSTNTSWFAMNAGDVDITIPCEGSAVGSSTITDGTITSYCSTDESEDWQALYFDFGSGGHTEDVSSVIIYDAMIENWDDACIEIHVWPTLTGDWYYDEFVGNEVIAGTYCGTSDDGDNIWAAIEFNQTFETRHLAVVLTKDGVSQQDMPVFSSISEIEIY